jgi:hypothetical protein
LNAFQRALRDFQDFSEDVSRANYHTADDALRRLASTMVPGTPLGDVVRILPGVDFDRWYATQAATGGSMVGSAELAWPGDPLERLAMQCELFRRLGNGQLDLLSFAHTFLWASSRHDDNIAEFVQQIFRPFARDFLRFVHDDAGFEQGLKQKADLPSEANMDELTLFISHSGADTAVAKALVDLFEKALKISARQIRCTSLDGYRLPAGADTNEKLRTEVFGAKLFVGLLTPTSLSSTYVLFELGARWGARRPLFPVLAGGTITGDLKPPLSGLNALSASSGDQIRQLVEDAAASLSMRVEPMATFTAAIEALVLASISISRTA